MIEKKLRDRKVNLQSPIMKSILKKTDNQGDGSRYFSEKIVEWYRENHRKLPWRETRDPYRIWLSEVILQQTRVAQGLPYYQRFISHYPSVFALASAPEEEVLRHWQGLGYYTRARNLIRCAKVVVSEHGGCFPNSYEKLRSLPGIGDYTAAAIASIAFDEPVAVLDGNVFRVLARYFGVRQDIAQSSSRKVFADLAATLIPREYPGTYNQGVMEFGALCCVPKAPQCADCTLAPGCYAREHRAQTLLPVRNVRKSARKRYFYYFVFISGNRIAMRKRSDRDIWQNLYDFYVAETSQHQTLRKVLEKDEKLRPLAGRLPELEITGTYRHKLTHQEIHARFVVVRPPFKRAALPTGLTFFSKKGLERLPKPVLISRFLADRKIL
jgi:A/G-specific adenine glycosylase